MSAISVHQPWAWLIVNGHKDIENRNNPPAPSKCGQRIAIHAPMRRITKDEFKDFLDIVKERKIKSYPKTIEDFIYGAIIGTVLLLGAEKRSKSFWANPGSSHWKLCKSKKIRPIKMLGRQFWFSAKIKE